MTFIELVTKQTGAIVSVDATSMDKSIELRVHQPNYDETADFNDSSLLIVRLTDEEASRFMVALGAAIQFARYGGGA